MSTKGRSTQAIVNSFPAWSNTRTDEQSLGQQLVNPVGKALDRLRKELKKIEDNQYLTTANLGDIGSYYKIKLGNDFVFSKDDNDNTDFIFTPPITSGVIGETLYKVSIADKNNIESFWYDPVPDRLSLVSTSLAPPLIASGYISSSPFSPIPVMMSGWPVPNKITVTISGGTSFIGIESNNQRRRGLVQITGKNREGSEITEELIFVHDETRQSLNEFKEVTVSGLRVYGIKDTDKTTVKFTTAAFNLDDYPVNYNLDVSVHGDDIPFFWKIGSGINTKSTLDLVKYDTDDLELRMDGFVAKHTFLQQELLNSIGSGIYAKDLAVEPHSDRLWLVDDTSLYIYSTDIPSSDMALLDKKDYNADSVIAPSSYYAIYGETVEIDYLWKRPIQGMVAHRAWVIKPDGSKYSLENGLEVAYHTDSSSWIFGEPRGREIRPVEFYTLNQRGDYVFCLEVKYTDESTSLDQRVISVLSKSPLAQFNLQAIGINTVEGIDFDSEYNLWILGSNDIRYKVNRHYDKMLIDFTRKIIYFREKYDQIRII